MFYQTFKCTWISKSCFQKIQLKKKKANFLKMQLSTFPFSISQVTVLYLQQLHRGFWLSSLPGSEASTKKQKKKKKKKKKREKYSILQIKQWFPRLYYINNKKTKTNEIKYNFPKILTITPQFLKPTTHGKILKYPIKKDYKKVF